MNTETQITDFFKRRFRDLARDKKRSKGLGMAHSFVKAKAAITFDIACQVLSHAVARQMAEDARMLDDNAINP